MRQTMMESVKRVVIKIGTNTIMQADNQVNYRKLERLAFVVSSLQQAGKEVLIVSSGAVGVGASALSMKEYPQTIAEQQALAAVGQGILMGHYNRFFSYYNVQVGQILLTRDVVDFPQSHENVQRAMETLISKGIVPIINENDTVAVDELNHETKFGDNDSLSAIVSGICQADLLIIMSDVDGLYDANPKINPEAVLIDWVTEINESIREMAQGKGSEFSSGGMATKLQAGEIILGNDQAMIITSGEDPMILFDILEGQPIGTLFMKEKVM